MRVVILVLAAILVSAASIAQPLKLVPSTLVVPPKFQKYFDSTHTINLPKGFTASVYYTGTLSSPRFMEFDPSGVLCLADQSNSNVVAFPDADSNGVADTAIIIATGTDGAHSIAFHDGNLYAATKNHVWRYDGPPKAGVYTSRQLFIDSIGSAAEGAPNHTTRTILFDDASQSLFVSVGSPCNACRERDTTRASIQRYNFDGTNRSIYATGLRNAVGLAMDSSHQLWATVAERNNLGADVPDDLITRIAQNVFYGWPYAYGDHQWVDFAADSEYHAMLPLTSADSVRVKDMLVPDATVAAHSTPLGIVYCKNVNLPAMFDNTFLVAIHGSYQGTDGRLVANGSKIVLLSNIGGKWTTQDFCTGLLTDSINYTRWARPCGIIMDRKGNIYFSSDHTAPHVTPAVYRISYDPNASVARSLQSSDLIEIVQDMTGVDITINSSQNSTILLFDMLGRSLPIQLNEHGTSGDRHAYHLDPSGLERGMYWIVVDCGGQRMVRRIMR
jgi:glucose/arabinose dehydrogenase